MNIEVTEHRQGPTTILHFEILSREEFNEITYHRRTFDFEIDTGTQFNLAVASALFEMLPMTDREMNERFPRLDCSGV